MSGFLTFAPYCLLAASAPTTAAQLALYQSANSEKNLIEGAKREDPFMLYTSHT